MKIVFPAQKDSKILLTLAMPVMVTQLSMTPVQIVDTMFIGKIGPAALGAAAVTGIIIFNITAVGDGLSTGMVATISRMIGERDDKSASIFATTGVVILAVIGSLITPLLLVGAPLIFHFMQIPSELSGEAWAYYSVFISFIPAMGVQGAAAASGISFLAGMGILVFLSISTREGLLCIRRSHISFSHFMRKIRIGIPSMMERFAMSFSQLLVMSLAVNPMGSIAIASFHIVMKLASLSFMPGFGFAIATASLTGQHLGASDSDGAERMMWIGTLYCGLLMGIISITYFLFPEFLTSLFTGSQDIIILSKVPLRIYACFVIFLAPAMVLRGGLQGAGDTRFTLIIMLASRFLIRLPLAWFLGMKTGFGLGGVWFAMCLDFLLRGGIFAGYARRGRWKSVRV